jgi:trehalose-6-phosphatase
MIHAQNGKDVVALSPASVTAGATAAVNIDTKGADYATIRVAYALGNTATIASSDGVTVKLTESTDTNPSNATTFVADKTGGKLSREVLYHIDTKTTRKRYLRLSVIPGTSGVSNETAVVAAFATLTRNENSPTATNDMVGGTSDFVVIS